MTDQTDDQTADDVEQAEERPPREEVVTDQRLAAPEVGVDPNTQIGADGKRHPIEKADADGE